MNSSSVPVRPVQPRSARRATWCLEDLARRDGDRLAVDGLDVGEDDDRLLVPGNEANRGEVGREGEVAVAALPRGEREAVDGVHVDVGGEKVAAAFDRLRRPDRRRRIGRRCACPEGGPACR